MSELNRTPYGRSYMTRIFPDETQGGCRVDIFRHKMVTVDNEDYVKGSGIFNTNLTAVGDISFPISASESITGAEMWEFFQKWTATKSPGEEINNVTIHCPKGRDYHVELTFGLGETAHTENFLFNAIITDSVALDSGRVVSVSDVAAGVIGLGEYVDPVN